jgi:hypothetical protein
MGTLDRIRHYRLRRDRILQGKFNCIPWPFQRFKNYVPGTEKGKYIIITANQKVGKSKLADYIYVYNIILFAIEHPEIKFKIIYFTLEMSASSKKDEFLSFLLNYLDNIQISPTDLNSVDNEKPVDEEILALLESEKYKLYIDKFDEIVTYIDDIRNPTGINMYCKDYALKHGHINYTDETYIDSQGNTKHLIDKDNPYTFENEEEYRFVIIDNASNFTQEQGLNKMDTINKASKYFITLRDQLLYSIILIQHQAQAQEGVENRKMGLLKPSSDGLADCKTTSRDCNILLGLYSPFKYGIPEYEGYDIKQFKNYIRFLEVLEDRDYGANGQICPLFFNGAISTFHELPRPDDPEMKDVYNYVNKLNTEKNSKAKAKVLFLIFSRKIKKLWHQLR